MLAPIFIKQITIIMTITNMYWMPTLYQALMDDLVISRNLPKTL